MTTVHLRVYERQGPCLSERAACSSRVPDDALRTPVVANVTCAKCRGTRLFREAGGKPMTRGNSASRKRATDLQSEGK